MRALVLDVNPVRYLRARAAARLRAHLVHHPSFGCVDLRDVPRPEKPGSGWVRIRPLLAGLCGSDLAAIELKTSPVMSPFSSFPCVLGHEILAETLEETPGIPAGSRVVVDPFLPCRTRDLPDCTRCREGEYCRCENVAEGRLSPGMFQGYTRDVPGGFCEETVSHRTQLFRVPDSLDDETAVLAEPLAVGVRAVLRNEPAKEARVLVVGGGTMAFSILWALRALGRDDVHVTMSAPARAQRDLARHLGADDVTAPRKVTEAAERTTGARRYKALLGGDVLQGGFDQAFDCVGSGASLNATLRHLRAGGRLVLVGGAGKLETVDWTFVWTRELTVRGTLGYGYDEWRGHRLRTLDITLRLLAEDRIPIHDLVTHAYPLEAWREALELNLNRDRTGAVKTVFKPG